MRASRFSAFPIPVLLALPCAAPALATEFQAFGGRGDAPYRATCRPGSYMVGLKYRSGAWMDQLSVICRAAKSDGTFGGLEYGQTFGGNGGGPDEKTCPAGSVIRDMQAPTTKDDGKVLAFTFGCVRGMTWPTPPVGALSIGTFSVSAASSTFRGWQTCPNGEAATGIHGGYGKHVNSAGLICSAFVAPKPPPPPKKDPAAEAAAAEAFKNMRLEEMRVTGKSPGQCQASFAQCSARLRAQLGPVHSIGPIASECQPFLSQCLANAAAAAAKDAQPAVQTAKVILNVDVYDEPNENGDATKKGFLRSGDQVTLAAPCVRSWCRVQGNNVPGGDGFVYSGPGYVSLQF